MRALLPIILLGTVAGPAFATGHAASLPQLTGSLKMAGLGAPVTIARDRYGIPRIVARSEKDGAFGLGFVHGQDRLWQMDYIRRVAGGRLAAVAGPAHLNSDRYYRTLGLEAAVKQEYARLEAHSRAVVDAYADGVNAAIVQQAGNLPPEFVMLNYQADPWEGWHSLLLMKWLAWDLGKNWGTELERFGGQKQLTSRQIFELNQVNKDEDLPTMLDLDAIYGPIARHGPVTGNHVKQHEEALGSNNWAISGARSSTGKPILANDPHLPLSHVSNYYLARIDVAGEPLVGATMPGGPSIRIGRNRTLAWSFTSMAPDAQDLVLEKLVAGKLDRIQRPDGDAVINSRVEQIDVKGEPSVQLTIRTTPDGPVISDLFPSLSMQIGADHVMAVRWVGFSADDGTWPALMGMGRARNWTQFRAALAGYVGPQLNIVYADTAGTISFRAAGSVPVRAKSSETYGLVPAVGWHGKDVWTGLVPESRMPETVNPPSGWLGTANQKTTPPGFQPAAFPDAIPNFRFERITTLLANDRTFSPEDMRAMLLDVHSDLDLRFRDLMLPLLKPGIEPAIVAELAQWDGQMQTSSRPALIMANWVRHVTRATYADELGDSFASGWRVRSGLMFPALAGVGGLERWCDDIRTAPVETCRDIVNAAYVASLEDLSQTYGADRQGWTWGKAHRALFIHPLFSRDSAEAALFNQTPEISGGQVTLNVAYFGYGESPRFDANVGPTYRAVYDLADLDRSGFSISSGQSGHPLSPHYNDLRQTWLSGELAPIGPAPAGPAPGWNILQLVPR